MTHTLLTDDSTPGVVVVTLNRAERMNALDGATLAALNDAVLTAAESGSEIRVIVIPGSGCALLRGQQPEVAREWRAHGSGAHMRHQDLTQDMSALMAASRQIVIASVNGYAVAGDFELVLASDIVVVDEQAALGEAHLQRNLLPSGGGSQRLPRRIGVARAMYSRIIRPMPCSAARIIPSSSFVTMLPCGSTSNACPSTSDDVNSRR
ncbi:enoyl-CoA hydratase/isomerase family protein [Burkholderia diffusa]|uniref:enoyl-CoA hydratase/isomerase family protein n=1 Tax=Burkholderia diffusa TaxID=488732 RepID=UPI00264D95B4|nr:enoyl-CoA hydratase/isomerase family protein [Burkholderia diffusa]MDN7907499.1 enoyl-CoA hydratase/isomerase family protein [Burkholderia diffusa]